MKAIIVGVSGQDGSHMADFLLEKGYEVHGVVRRNSQNKFGTAEHLKEKIEFYYGDITDANSIDMIIKNVQPNEIYNFSAQSHVGVSFQCPFSTMDIVGTGVLRILEAIRRYSPHSKLYQASSSEMFGSSKPPQNEDTPFEPQSPYAIAKLTAHYLVKLYRQAYGIFACSGICFNHEGERRGSIFVTRLISKAVAKAYFGVPVKIQINNLEAKRDWGYAKDYIKAMWMMLQQDKPDDYVIATGEAHSVQEFLEEAFGLADLNWKDYVDVVPSKDRPLDVNFLLGDSSKARKELDWKPEVGFKELVKIMVESDIKELDD